MTQPETLQYQYLFHLVDGRNVEIPVVLDTRNLSLISEKKHVYPEWVLLSYQQCRNCSLDGSTARYCPAAAALSDIVLAFKGVPGDSTADITVHSPHRNYLKRTTVEEGVSSLAGLCLSTCGCPVLSLLRPLVNFHLPFSTIDETRYRVISMYLMAQFLGSQKGAGADWKLERLKNLYEEIQVVNKGLEKRFAGLAKEGVHLNALVKLDCYVKDILLSLSDDEMLGHVRQLFSVYL